MKNLAKLLCLVLALCMVCGSAFAVNEQRPVNLETYADESEEIYMNILGEYYEYYNAAMEAENVSERYTLMAIAEAKLLESGVFIPLTSKGGLYGISRVVPYSVSPVLWGNDSYRFHQAIVCSDPIKAADREVIKAKWAELRGTGTFEAWAKSFVAEKGYTVIDAYNMGYTSDPQTWDVLATSRAADSEAIVNTYDGLMEYDNENILQPSLATAYTVSEDGLTYTFTLRDNVYWVDSQGREVAKVCADDFVAGMQHMMDAAGGLEYLVGVDGCGIANADEYVYGEVTDFAEVGVKAVDELTVSYTLNAPCPFFTTMLGYGVFAPMSRTYYTSQGGKFGAEFNAEAEDYLYGKDPDHIAYCGPYLVTNLTSENTIIFSANEKYWNKDNINIKSITWKFNDGSDELKAYNDMKSGEIVSCSLTNARLQMAKDEGLFEEYAFIGLTDATSYVGFINVNRHAYANFNDETKVVSTQTAEDAERIHAAMQNAHFRRALVMSLDRATYNAQTDGEECKYNALINSYTPGTFVTLFEDVTVAINGTDTSFPAGTMYGAILQAQIDADGVALKVWDAENFSSSGFDGWYNPEAAAAELKIAVEELAAQGIVVDAEHPLYVDLPVYVGSTIYANRGEVLKQSVEASTNGYVIVNKTACETAAEWYYSGYYTDYGYDMNGEICDLSGWGPDYGDPQSYLATMLPYGSGYMCKSLGLF